MPNASSVVLCPVCGSSKTKFESSHVDRRKGLAGRWTYFSCCACKVAFLNPIPSLSELAAYYSAYYRENDHCGNNVAAGRGDQYPWLRRMFHCVSGDVDPRDFIEAKPGARILDFGSGVGTYLSFFQRRGAKISGAEISSAMVSRCVKAGYDVRQTDDLLTIPFSDSEFEVVYLMQVFEHLADPHEMMSEICRVLKEEGIAYFAVPNGRSLWRRVFRGSWVSGWFAPFHIFVYDINSLSYLADAHGFHVEKYWSRSPDSWWRLNLLAAIDTKGGIASSFEGVLGNTVIRGLLICILRLVELFTAERDCLVVRMTKVARP